MKKILIISMLFCVSCSTTYERSPSSLENSRFLTLLDDIEASVDVGTESPEVCSITLKGFYKDLYNIDSESIELEQFSQKQFEDFVKTSFLVRIQLKERMKILNIEQEHAKECLDSIKDVARAMRYLEDYFIEMYYTKAGRMNDDFSTFSGEGIHFLVNPKYDFNSAKDLVSGDVLLSRGLAYSSAAIARIGDNDTQFSHLSLVYKDKKSQKLHTSEAHIEIGSVVAPIDVHIDQGNSRTVLFRMDDSNLAHEAGKYMHERITTHKEKTGKNIQYDFSMDYHDSSRIFCSEIVSEGYKEAGKKLYNKDVDIPMYKTTFEKGIVPFLKKIGLKVNSETIDDFDTFGPGEIQFDSRFDIIAEWRNPKKLRESRFHDAILTKVFQYMEEDNYRLRPSLVNSLAHSTAWILRRSAITRALVKKLSGSDLAKSFPLNMTVKQMNVFVVLDKVGEAMYSKLESAQAKTNRPLSFKELYRVLDNYRASDLKAYKKYRADQRHNAHLITSVNSDDSSVQRVLKRPEFHLFFRN